LTFTTDRQHLVDNPELKTGALSARSFLLCACRDWQLPATSFVTAAVTVAVDAVATAFDRLTNQSTGKTTGNRAYSCTAPAMADGATDNRTGAGADRGALLCRGAGRKCADNSGNKDNLLHHGVTPQVSAGALLDATHQDKDNDNDEH
jgi:hypothetical protein